MDSSITYMFTAYFDNDVPNIVFYDVVKKDLHSYICTSDGGEYYKNGERDYYYAFYKYHIKNNNYIENIIHFDNSDIYFDTRQNIIDEIILHKIFDKL